MILKKYKNRIFKVIENLGWQTSNFETVEVKRHTPNNHAFALRYKKSKMNFLFVNHETDFHSFKHAYSQFNRNFTQTSESPQQKWLKFEQVLDQFSHWINHELKNYIEEDDEIDLWTFSTQNSSKININNINLEDNSQFTDEEQNRLKVGITEIKKLIESKFSLNEAQTKELHKKLDYQEKALSRLSKLDWKNGFLGGMFSVIIAMSMDTDTGKQIWGLMLSVLENLPELPSMI